MFGEILADECLVKKLFNQILCTRQWRTTAYEIQVELIRREGPVVADALLSARKALREYRKECSHPPELEHNGRHYQMVGNGSVMILEVKP